MLIYTLIIIIAVLIVIVVIFINQEKFGKLPSNDRLKKIEKSKNYKDNQFQNQSFTPSFSGDDNVIKVFWDFFFQKSKFAEPKQILPSEKFTLPELNTDNFAWFGHSSYYLQIDEKKILIDPVFSGAASPVSFTTKSFNGADVVNVDDFDKIDYLIITHDHWDHLDYETVKALKPKVKNIITGLGTGEHLEYWGLNPKIIHEKDWYENIKFEDGFEFTALPARHFSGRGFLRNKALWISISIKSPNYNIFIGGDSGYDKHFKEIGKNYGPYDLAFLENGQYNKNWRYIHSLPEESALIGEELNAKYVVPVHWSKFSLALHSWFEPIEEFLKYSKKYSYKTITPKIGEVVRIDNNYLSNYQNSKWWDQAK